MNILRESNPQILGFLGGLQKRYMNLKYRFIKSLVVTEYQDRIILYNTLTGAVVSLFDFEYNNIHTELPCDYSNFLYSNYFLVREDFDENKVIDDYKLLARRYISPTYLDNLAHYTILTTHKCNARCPYCYEQLIPNKQHMTEEVAMDVAKYIIDNSVQDRPITLEWFGGEPLYNAKAIDIISSTACSAGMNFTSNMISNGYLFTEELANKAINMWHLQNVQITLDGTEENYNKTKRYIYKNDPSPFKTVMKNMHLLLDKGIGVTVRLNCNKDNYKDLIELVKFLKEEFAGYNNISVYVWEIFANGKRTEEEANDMYKSIEEVDKVICEKGLAITNSIAGGIKAQHCLVDSGEGVSIGVDGRLFLCEHYIYNDFFGDIYHPEVKDFENFKKWRNYTDNHSEQCLNCPLRATCLKVKGCTDEFECIGFEKEFHINQTKRHMMVLQDDFNNSFTCNDCNISCCGQN